MFLIDFLGNALRLIFVDQWPITLTVVLGFAAIYMLLPRPQRRPVLLGGAAAALALLSGCFLLVRVGGFTVETVLFYVFALVSVVAGGLLVTQRNPARAALAFALAILAVCGLFLLLAAPFLMAATIIVYAGAIIVTFLFVLMLAQQQGPSDADSRSREPILASATGFVLLGALLYLLHTTYGNTQEDWHPRIARLESLRERVGNRSDQPSREDLRAVLADDKEFVALWRETDAPVGMVRDPALEEELTQTETRFVLALQALNNEKEPHLQPNEQGSVEGALKELAQAMKRLAAYSEVHGEWADRASGWVTRLQQLQKSDARTEEILPALKRIRAMLQLWLKTYKPPTPERDPLWKAIDDARDVFTQEEKKPVQEVDLLTLELKLDKTRDLRLVQLGTLRPQPNKDADTTELTPHLLSLRKQTRQLHDKHDTLKVAPEAVTSVELTLVFAEAADVLRALKLTWDGVQKRAEDQGQPLEKSARDPLTSALSDGIAVLNEEKSRVEKDEMKKLTAEERGASLAAVAQQFETIQKALKQTRARLQLRFEPMSAMSGPPSSLPPGEIRRNEYGEPQLPAENAAYLGQSLFSDYLVAVEMGGMLLLIATIGAIAIATRHKSQSARRPVQVMSNGEAPRRPS